jgi:hypothetical protein
VRELLSGPAAGVVDWIEFFGDVTMLRVNAAVVRLASALIENRVMAGRSANGCLSRRPRNASRV